MKKYFQIVAVVGSFFLVSFVRNEGNGQAADLGTLPPSSPPTQVPASPTPSSSSLQVSPVTQQVATPTPLPTQSGKYKDGSYTGSEEDAYYGLVQVKAIIAGGRLTDIQFLEYPNDNNTSLAINSEALPLLKSEAISAQSARIDIISSASETSPAFIKSLSSALQQAQ